jgi:hypothetical protein
MLTKKKYVSPSIEVTELEVMEPILALSVEDEITADPNEEVLSNRHRGEWGDFWTDK